MAEWEAHDNWNGNDIVTTCDREMEIEKGNCVDKCRCWPRVRDQMFSIPANMINIYLGAPRILLLGVIAHLQEFICNLDVCCLNQNRKGLVQTLFYTKSTIVE